MAWHYAIGTQPQGPFADEEFDRLVQAGTIRPETRVWKTGMGDWQPYAAVMPTGTATVDGEEAEVCAVSGKRYPRRMMIPFEGKWISAEHRDEFFQRLREGVGGIGIREYGGFWIRFAAKFIDGVVLNILEIPVKIGLSVALLGTWNFFTGITPSMSPRSVILFQALSILVSFVINFFYAWITIRKYDATLGKMALGLKLIRPDGSRLSNGRIIGRFFAEWVSGMTLGIGYIIAAFDDQKRSLHDRIADTRVVRAK